MPEQIPSVAELRNSFRRLIIRSVPKCQETGGSYFGRLLRSQTSAPWIDVGPNVQTLQVEPTLFLVRASWQFTLDPHAVTQSDVAQAQVVALAATIVSAIPQGATVEAAFEFPPTEVTSTGKQVTCLFKGVVRKHPPETGEPSSS